MVQTPNRVALILTLAVALFGCGGEYQPGAQDLSNTFGHSFPNFAADSFINPKAKYRNFEISNLAEFDRVVANQFSADGLHDSLSLKAVRQRVSGEGDGWNDSFLREYSIQSGGIDICGAQVKTLKLSQGYDAVALSHIPEFDADSVSGEWIAEDDAHSMFEFAIRARGVDFASAKVGDSSKCYLADSGNIRPVWKIGMLANNVLYTGFADKNGVYDLTPVNFHATGTATVYESNPTDGELRTFELSEMDEAGYLENLYFSVSTTGTKVQQEDFMFDFDPEDESDEFDQTSLFVHVNLQYDWFRDLGHRWTSDSKLTIVAHAIVNGSVNNALYTPGTSASPPRIQVGDGDGVRLQNLPKDGDVVSHELGHHIVYDSLKEVKGESLVMHEGLADFFTFARTGDSCLGESICPADSDVGCEIDAECLRTASNEYVLGENTKPEAHFKSQFVSGMLWDLRGGEIPKSKLHNIAYRGVSLLLESSGYHDLVLGLLIADEDLYDGQYCDDIYQKAIDRGLEDFISDFGCDGDLPSLNALNGSSGTTASSKKRGSTSDDPLSCGVLAGKGSSGPWWLLLLILPLALPLMRRKSGHQQTI